MYLPVPFFGYLCDRYSPSPLSLLSAVLFGGGYSVAALTYKSGPPPDAGGSGWPFWVMILAFVLVGAGTSCLYLAAVTTCAKNFGRGKYKGIMLAVPIAAFGLSGMWQSQVGTYLLCERLADGSRGDVDVFRYFLFLALLLFVIGVVGTFGLRIVDDEEERYIDEAVDELERSGIVDESDFFQSRNEVRAAYGTFAQSGDESCSVGSEDQSLVVSDEEREARRREKEREEEERRKKDWLLNYETRLFLKDHTMWWLALGFFLVTGPGEAYINNVRPRPFIFLLDQSLTALLAGNRHPNPHTTLISLQATTSRRPPFNPRNHHRNHLNHSPSPNRLPLRPLRTPSNPPLPKPRRSPIIPSPLIYPSNPLPSDIPPPFRPPPLPGLPPSSNTPNTRTPATLPRNNRPRRRRLRRSLLASPDPHLRRMGRREFRHELGHRGHGSCWGRCGVGRDLLERVSGVCGRGSGGVSWVGMLWVLGDGVYG